MIFDIVSQPKFYRTTYSHQHNEVLVQYLGSYGEHAVLAELLKADFESYLAIKANQKEYDITVVLNKNSVKRIQVKSTILQDGSTAIALDGTEKNRTSLLLWF